MIRTTAALRARPSIQPARARVRIPESPDDTPAGHNRLVHQAKTLRGGDSNARREAEAAFARLWEIFGGVVGRFARARVPRDWEDICQNTWVKAWRSLATYDERRGTFANWILRVAQSEIIDSRRRIAVRPRTATFTDCTSSTTNPDDYSNREPVPATQPTQSVRGQASVIDELVQELSPRRRMTFELHAAGYSHLEVGQALGMSVSRVKVQLNEARRVLRSRLEGAGEVVDQK